MKIQLHKFCVDTVQVKWKQQTEFTCVPNNSTWNLFWKQY